MPRHQRKVSTDLAYLRSKDFDVVEVQQGYTALQRVTGQDFGSSIRLAKCLPLALRGDDHKQARRALTGLLASKKDELAAALPELIDRRFQVLRRQGTHDFLNDVLVPFVDDVMVFLGGFHCDSTLLSMNSSIFDPASSPARRRKLEASARDTFNAATTAFPKASDAEIDCRVSTVVMGHDALLGGLALSLQAHFQESLGKPISNQAFPREPLGTGVPYVWRQKVASNDESFEAQAVGEIIEIRLDHFAEQEAHKRMNFFGGGRHVCPGRALALKIFEGISQYISCLDVGVTESELNIDTKHVLTIPKSMTVSVREV